MALLEVRDLEVSFQTTDGLVQAVRGVSFSVEAGQTLGIVGRVGFRQERLDPDHHASDPGGADLRAGAVERQGPPDDDGGRVARGARRSQIAMIFQDPLSSLHPYYRVGWQIVEMIRAHEPHTSKAAARKRAIDLLRLVGIPQPDRRVDDFPHQFSGGMRQRAMIAMAMALNPALLIADEPTTALDVTVQAQVLRVIERLQQEFGTAVILITHDLGVIAEVADDVIVMYAGRVMEAAARDPLFYDSHHPYTEGLLRSLPAYGGDRARLHPDPRSAPELDRPCHRAAPSTPVAPT